MQRTKGHNLQKRRVLVIWDDQIAEHTMFFVLTGLPSGEIKALQDGAHNQFVDETGRRSVHVRTLQQVVGDDKFSKQISVQNVAAAGPYDSVLISGVRKLAA